MNIITIDHNTFNHLKKNIGNNLTGSGYEKPKEYLFESHEVASGLVDPDNIDDINKINLEAEGKIEIHTKLSLEEYKKFVEDTYNDLKFIRSFDQEYIQKQINIALYLYHLNPSLVNRTDKEILDRKKWLKEVELDKDEITFSDLSHNNNNYTGYDIFLKNNEIHFNQRFGFQSPPKMNLGNIELINFTSQSISHINIKDLPFNFKEDLNIHPSLYKRTQKKELIEANIYESLNRYSDLLTIDLGNKFDNVKITWDKNDKKFLEYVEKGNSLIPKIKKIHGYKDTDKFGPFMLFIKEMNYRITMDSINEHLVMMEVYIKSVDSLRAHDEIAKYSPEDSKKHTDFIEKYKKIEELIPLFPITLFVQKRRAEIIKESHPHLFNTGKEGLSYFE